MSSGTISGSTTQRKKEMRRARSSDEACCESRVTAPDLIRKVRATCDALMYSDYLLGDLEILVGEIDTVLHLLGEACGNAHLAACVVPILMNVTTLSAA